MDGPHSNRVPVHPEVTVDPDGLDGQEDREVLPGQRHGAACRRGLNLFLHDCGGLSNNGHPLRGHLANDADRERGAWEGLPLRHADSEGTRGRADFVFVQVPQRLEEPEFHAFRKARDVVVCLDSIP